MQNEFVVKTKDAGKRLDVFAAENCNITRTQSAALIEKGFCSINGVVTAKNSRKLQSGENVKVILPETAESGIVPEEIPLDIVYEDNELLIVNKTRGLVVHPSHGHDTGTLVNALLFHCKDLSGINGERRPGILHRIDKDTSGLLLVAKNDNAHVKLAAQIKEHTMTREYEAVVSGIVKENGEVRAPIGRSKTDRKKMCVTAYNSKLSATRYEIVKNYKTCTHLRLTLETGRTHQIRVHMAYIGHPVLGDYVYGNGKPKWLNGQCLHARKLGFVHPSVGEYMEFSSELPEYFIKILQEIE
jgi:23S rRNA pseudouridine1911/1915/1917 synthase